MWAAGSLNRTMLINKLKSLKVAQSKDDDDGGVCMNGCESDGSV